MVGDKQTPQHRITETPNHRTTETAGLPVTVVIATKNEELNLRAALESVGWADQVLVVDSASTDGTIAIAEQFARTEVLQFKYDGGWPRKRNWALREGGVRNDWVLVLDADERVSPELLREIDAAIRQEHYVGFNIRWKFMFLGRWMKHSWSHGWMLRLFRHGKAEYEDLGMGGEGSWDAEVHENIVSRGGPCGRLKEPLTHDSEQSLSFWVRKQNEFSDWNARRRLRQLREPIPPASWLVSRDPSRRRRFLKAVFLRLPCKPTLLFAYLYLWKLGFLDGKAGLYFCRLRAAHELNIGAKIYEMNSRK